MGGLPREVSQLNQLLSIPCRGPTWGLLFNGGPPATCHTPIDTKSWYHNQLIYSLKTSLDIVCVMAKGQPVYKNVFFFSAG